MSKSMSMAMQKMKELNARRSDQIASITLEEKERILAVAEGLIKEPAHWTKGRWKCKATRIKRDNRGRFAGSAPACDANGNQLYQYCIQGAVNEALVRVLGKERADELYIVPDSRQPTEWLGLNKVTLDLYGEGDAMYFNDREGTKHEQIVNILRTGLKQVRAAIKKGKVKS